MTLGNIIKQSRRSLKLTQKEVAREAGISERFVIYIEKDKKRPSFDVLKKICKALNIKSLPLE